MIERIGQRPTSPNNFAHCAEFFASFRVKAFNRKGRKEGPTTND